MAKTKGAKDANRSDFISGLKGDSLKRLKEATKATPGGFTTDEEVIELYELEEGVKKIIDFKVVKVTCGRDKNKKRYVKFDFVDLSGENKGTKIGKYFGIGPSSKAKSDKEKAESELKSWERLFVFFQTLGYDTSEWADADNPLEEVADAAAELTKNHPTGKMQLSTWGDDDDQLGIDIKSLKDSDSDDEDEDEDEDKKPKSKSKSKAKKAKDEDEDEEEDDDDEDSDDSDEDDEDEDSEDDDEDEEEEEEKPVKKGKAKGKKEEPKAKAKKSSKKSKDEDEDEDEDEEEVDHAKWVDYEAFYTKKGTKKPIAVVIKKWSPRKGVFECFSEINDKTYKDVKPEELSFE